MEQILTKLKGDITNSGEADLYMIKKDEERYGTI